MVTKIKSDAIITLVEFGKAKILAQGVVSDFINARVCSQEGYEISVLCKGSLKKLRAADSAWIVDEVMPKRFTVFDLIKH